MNNELETSSSIVRNNNERFLMEFDELRKIVVCPICLSNFIDPVSLSCGHTFCKECVNNALNVRDICPLCSNPSSKRKLVESSESVVELFSLLSDFVSLLEPTSYGSVVPTFSVVPSNKISTNMQTITTSETISPGIDIVNESAASHASNIVEALIEPEVFKPGVLVNVLKRTWSGINKLGGIGWVINAHYNEGSFIPYEYDVKYVLDSTTDFHIPAAFVEAHVELDRTSRRSRTKTSPAPVSAPSSSSKNSNNGSASKSTSDNKKRKAVSLPHDEPLVPMVILTTAVSPAIIEQLGQLTLHFPHVSVATQFSPAVTHVVVTVDRYGVLKKRTMKYMQAIIGGLWVVSSNWVQDCFNQKMMLKELNYEVSKNAKASLDNAPQRARIFNQKRKANALRNNGRVSKDNLFSQCIALLYGQFPTPGPPRSDIEELLTQGGATVTLKVDTFIQWVLDGLSNNNKSKTTHYVVVCTSVQFKEEFIAQLPPSLSPRVNVSGEELISVVSPLWTFDSITNYDFQHPSLYLCKE